MKNKLSDIKFKSVDLVKRGANQDAHIKLFKSDTPTDETKDRHILKKAFDYLKALLYGEEPESITKSDVVKEYDGYATQLLRSFDSIMDDDSLSTDGKTEMMQKSIQQFSDFMTEAVPVWANSQSVAKSEYLSDMIEKSENPDYYIEVEKKESDTMLSNLTPEEQATYKSLLAKIKGGAKKVETPDSWIDEGDDETKKKAPEVTKSDDVAKADIPEFVRAALEKSDNLIEECKLNEMKEVAKKYEILGEKADELGQQLYDLKKSDSKLYDSSIALLDRQVEALNKSGLFTEIGKSGAVSKSDDVVAKVEKAAVEIMKSNPLMTKEQAMGQVWEAHPELMAEYEG